MHTVHVYDAVSCSVLVCVCMMQCVGVRVYDAVCWCALQCVAECCRVNDYESLRMRQNLFTFWVCMYAWERGEEEDKS